MLRTAQVIGIVFRRLFTYTFDEGRRPTSRCSGPATARFN